MSGGTPTRLWAPLDHLVNLICLRYGDMPDESVSDRTLECLDFADGARAPSKSAEAVSLHRTNTS